MINPEDKAAAKAIRDTIRENMRAISDQLVKLAKLHGGDGYEFESTLRVFNGEVKGVLAGKAFKVDKDGQLEYLPEDVNPDESQRGTLDTEASVEVSNILKKLGIKEGK
jgi:hypothetical protein